MARTFVEPLTAEPPHRPLYHLLASQAGALRGGAMEAQAKAIEIGDKPSSLV